MLSGIDFLASRRLGVYTCLPPVGPPGIESRGLSALETKAAYCKGNYRRVSVTDGAFSFQSVDNLFRVVGTRAFSHQRTRRISGLPLFEYLPAVEVLHVITGQSRDRQAKGPEEPAQEGGQVSQGKSRGAVGFRPD